MNRINEITYEEIERFMQRPAAEVSSFHLCRSIVRGIKWLNASHLWNWTTKLPLLKTGSCSKLSPVTDRRAPDSFQRSQPPLALAPKPLIMMPSAAVRIRVRQR